MAELVIAGIEGNKIIPSADAKIITLMFPTYSPTDGSETSCFDCNTGSVYSVPVGKKWIMLNYFCYVSQSTSAVQIIIRRGTTQDSATGATNLIINRADDDAQPNRFGANVCIEVPASNYLTIGLNGTGSDGFAGFTAVGVEIDAWFRIFWFRR